ncbi:MAG TPA: hypothetical protein PLY87_25325 [Planctomycetaceae bacterium]|nr:hypothetical protein [Planctomycetaceae bacterium]
MKQRNTILFNNCKGRDHADAFNRADAFYDLNTFGRQANQATDLKVGQICVVAQSASVDDQIAFETFTVKSIKFLRDKYTGDKCRVFCGTKKKSEVLLRLEACEHALYGAVFDCRTHFKQTSVVSVDT